MGWSIVTSHVEGGARNLGQPSLRQHDSRYEVAEGFLKVLYKLWEGSREDGAVARGRDRGVFTDPSKVHGIGHKGRFLDVPGHHHLCESSPQPRRPSTGRAPRGPQRRCVLIAAPTRRILARYVPHIRRLAEEAGRGRHDLLACDLSSVVVTPRPRPASPATASTRPIAAR